MTTKPVAPEGAETPLHEPMTDWQGREIKGLKRCLHCGLSETYWKRFPVCERFRPESQRAQCPTCGLAIHGRANRSCPDRFHNAPDPSPDAAERSARLAREILAIVMQCEEECWPVQCKKCEFEVAALISKEMEG